MQPTLANFCGYRNQGSSKSKKGEKEGTDFTGPTRRPARGSERPAGRRLARSLQHRASFTGLCDSPAAPRRRQSDEDRRPAHVDRLSALIQMMRWRGGDGRDGDIPDMSTIPTQWTLKQHHHLILWVHFMLICGANHSPTLRRRVVFKQKTVK